VELTRAAGPDFPSFLPPKPAKFRVENHAQLTLEGFISLTLDLSVRCVDGYSILREVQDQARNEEPEEGQDEERQAGNEGRMPQVRHDALPHRRLDLFRKSLRFPSGAAKAAPPFPFFLMAFGLSVSDAAVAEPGKSHFVSDHGVDSAV
jgi:hypothetical protein